MTTNSRQAHPISSEAPTWTRHHGDGDMLHETAADGLAQSRAMQSEVVTSCTSAVIDDRGGQSGARSDGRAVPASAR